MGTRANRERVEHRPDQQNAPGPDTPAQMSAGAWGASLKRALKDSKEDRITLTGAGVAFYWFLAVFPLLIAAVGLLALVHASPSFLSGGRGGISKALPSEATPGYDDLPPRRRRMAGCTPTRGPDNDASGD